MSPLAKWAWSALAGVVVVLVGAAVALPYVIGPQDHAVEAHVRDVVEDAGMALKAYTTEHGRPPSRTEWTKVVADQVPARFQPIEIYPLPSVLVTARAIAQGAEPSPWGTELGATPETGVRGPLATGTLYYDVDPASKTWVLYGVTKKARKAIVATAFTNRSIPRGH